MQLQRNEIMTGLLVIGTIAEVTIQLVLLGTTGLFAPLVVFKIYLDNEAAAKMLEVIKPVAAEATNTMKDLQQTAQNLNRLTDENSELNLALTQFKTFGEHLSGLTAPDSALSHSLTNIEKISTSLTENDNIEVTLRNLRNSSEKLKLAVTDLEPAGENIKQFSETIKSQPWCLIWRTTKKYPETSHTLAIASERTITVRKTARAKPRARATPTRTSSR